MPWPGCVWKCSPRSVPRAEREARAKAAARRERMIREMEQVPIIKEIAASDVWEEHSQMTRDYRERNNV